MKLLSVVLVALLVSVSYGRSSGTKATCDPTICLLPNCLCSTLKPPAGLTSSQIPQIVYLTFDSALTVSNFPLYEEIFDRTNPNGAPISGTFFLTHDPNDYRLTHNMWRNGHEIALESITHKSNTTYWASLNYTGWVDEIIGQREMIAEFAQIPAEDIVGFRAPFLQIGGDAMVQAVYENGIQYDSSRTTVEYSPNLWPYTADYEPWNRFECQIAPCPVGSYPGFWVSPITDLKGGNNKPCSFVDSCLDPPTSVQETFNLLLDNFGTHYNQSRSPLALNVHSGWFENTDAPYLKQGYLEFLDYILSLGDTYIVSIKKGLEWVKAPVGLENIKEFAPWQKGEVPRDACRNSINCYYSNDETPSDVKGERNMRSCVLCPDYYPWVRNPLGEQPNV